VDLTDLFNRTGISRRKLRYCVDHQLIPALTIEIAADAQGRPRKFHEDVGVAIVCAARLQELGLPHERIRQFLGCLSQIPGPRRGTRALVEVIERRLPAVARLGDGAHVRLTYRDNDIEYDYDSGWRCGDGTQLPADYQPTVEVVLNLEPIFRQIFVAE
jgi:hypothetical protein